MHPMSERVRAIRGAVQVSEDTIEAVTAGTHELVTAMLDRNNLGHDDLISVIFTATPDLHTTFPAAAARGLGLGHIPLLCAAELDIEGAMPKVIRVMMHAYTDLDLRSINHVYLGGAQALRQDLAQ